MEEIAYSHPVKSTTRVVFGGRPAFAATCDFCNFDNFKLQILAELGCSHQHTIW
jgi:hypothetical protein